MTNPYFKSSRSVMCISIRQPWAEFIVHQLKSVENRNYKASFTGVLLIHASKIFDKTWKDQASNEIAHLGQSYIDKKVISSLGLYKMPTGKFVGAVIMTGYDRNYNSPWCQPNKYYHRYINQIKFFDPIEGKGMQRMFFPPAGFQTLLSQRDGIRFRRLLTISKELGFKTEMTI